MLLTFLSFRVQPLSLFNFSSLFFKAILSVLMNREEIDLGDELRTFREFTLPLPKDMRGLAISNQELIRSGEWLSCHPLCFH